MANGEDLTAREDLAIASVFGENFISQFYHSVEILNVFHSCNNFLIDGESSWHYKGSPSIKKLLLE